MLTISLTLFLGGLVSITAAFAIPSMIASASLAIAILGLVPIVFAIPFPDLPTHRPLHHPVVPMRRRVTINDREIELNGTIEV